MPTHAHACAVIHAASCPRTRRLFIVLKRSPPPLPQAGTLTLGHGPVLLLQLNAHPEGRAGGHAHHLRAQNHGPHCSRWERAEAGLLGAKRWVLPARPRLGPTYRQGLSPNRWDILSNREGPCLQVRV